jgi:hypothetical protein
MRGIGGSRGLDKIFSYGDGASAFLAIRAGSFAAWRLATA